MKLVNITSYIFATGFGCGYIPKIPGSVGSLVAVLVYWFYPVETFSLLTVSIFLFFIGVPTATIVERFEGKDSGKIVIDEITGQVLTFAFIPFSGINIILGFILFRFFDILKPYPINISQKLPNGWGVMIDDVLAAIYANIALRLILLIIN
ncbi:MAG: phosphatidylglycerophosphatase A [Calditrichia bacterium]|nr:phosphatidylglycerophosphatase A [Calditrichia bacterium]